MTEFEDPNAERHKEERRPVEEAGGGVSEGFEQAEEELRKQAEHDDPGTSPENDEFPEEESPGGEYGEADEESPPDA